MGEELAGDDKEMIASIKAALTPSENNAEMTEEAVDNLIRFIKQKRFVHK